MKIYILTITTLIVTAFLLIKKTKYNFFGQSQCILIDKKQLTHKTILYILDYQNQRFLLADNQQALTLINIPKEAIDAKT